MHSSVISVTALHGLLNTRPVIVLDCRYSLQDPHLGERLYSEGHIPGAFYCNLDQHLSGPRAVHGGRHPLPEPAQLAATLARWGITPLSHVVVYDDNRLGFAARAWYLLRAMGIQDVQVLDGGFNAWKQAHHPLDKRSPGIRRGHLRAPATWPDVVDYTRLCAELTHCTLIDSREAVRYRGDSEPIDPVAGHIPGARNQPWLNITDSDGFILPIDAQRQLWQPLLPDAAAPAVVYCGSGVTACVNLLSLHLCGYTDVRLYAGSWSDWCSRPEAPIATAL
jgi:thiosulfate/3-mercaptopyruvate sulfurtransferase